MLALRDERRSREFDQPDAWWPERPKARDVIGGRDRRAGGSWCVSDVAAGVSAVVLNRPDRMTAAVGAPSRGVLPLIAIEHGDRWAEHVDVSGMASFNLLLAGPHDLRWWSFDGSRIEEHALVAGTYVFKPRGRLSDRDNLDPNITSGRLGLDRADADPGHSTPAAWTDWFEALRSAEPGSDGTGLLVQRALDDGDTYETVFAQFIAARPGTLRIDYRRRPIDGRAKDGGDWTTRMWPEAG
jgi:hypothetical protein